MTLKDTRYLLGNGITPNNKLLRDLKETENHKDACIYMKKVDEISNDLVLKLHAILKQGVSEDAG